MNFAVEPDNQPGFNADEIDDKKLIGGLAAELHTQLGAAQRLPTQVFDGRGGACGFRRHGLSAASSRCAGQEVRFSGRAVWGSRFEPPYSSYFSSRQSIGPLNSGTRLAGFSPMRFAAARLPVKINAL